jgi:glycosyltransferase involved in cell wall biosynthesis
MSKKMILITDVDVWLLTLNIKKPGTGNQSLYNTLLGYARAGWEVHMLTNSMVLAGMPQIHEKVFIHRGPILIDAMFEKFKSVVKKILRLIKSESNSGSTKIRTELLYPPVRAWVYSRVFRWFMGRRAVRLSRKLGGVRFIYGHEVLGVLAGRFAADKLNLPLITRFQGTLLGQFINEPEKLLSYRTKVEALKTKADLIIMANDGTLGNKVLEFLGVRKEKYRFYMNGVFKDNTFRPDIDVTQVRNKACVPPENVFLLYVGRFFYFKRTDRLIKVFARALKEYPKMTLVMIGDGPERRGSENLAKELGLMDSGVFMGAMSHSEVIEYLNACDICVSFCDLSNLTNSLIEACICGKCIVTTAAGGTCDLLTDGINAVVVEKQDDVKAITQGLLRVVKNSKERNRLAEGARKRGSELKTWQERMQVEVEEVEKIL